VRKIIGDTAIVWDMGDPVASSQALSCPLS